MELIQYIRLFRKWIWLIVICAVLAGGAANISSNRPTPEDRYIAQVTLVVGTSISDPNPNYQEFVIGSNLAQTYIYMAENYEVLQGAIEAGNFNLTPGQLGGMLTANIVEGTQLITLRVIALDPVLAVDAVDEVAQQLILKSPSNLTPEQQAQLDLANSEIARLREQIDSSRARLVEVQNQLTTTTDPDEINQLNQQYDTLSEQIITASGTVANYQSTVSQIQMRSNVISIFEDARLSGVSSAPPSSPLRTTLLAIMVGAALAMGLALLIEYIDDSIRTPAQANDVLAIPTMAAIPRFGNRRSSYSDKLITYHKPSSPLSEEYRTLRTHLLYSMNGSSVTYIISSASPSEGKTITSANLAVTMANAGWRVLLIDADLRRPRQHDVFQLDNHVGLSTLLSTMPSEDGADLYYELSRRPELQDCIKDTQVPGLQVITSGPIPLNPVEVLGSASMHRWYECFVSSPDINIILFDTPPVLVSADAAVVSSVVDAPVVMVLEAGKTRPGGALRAKERLESLNVTIKGLVLNSVSSRDMKYYGDYYQYYYYYRDAEQVKQPERN